jgi:hypothetical protein
MYDAHKISDGEFLVLVFGNGAQVLICCKTGLNYGERMACRRMQRNDDELAAALETKRDEKNS